MQLTKSICKVNCLIAFWLIEMPINGKIIFFLYIGKWMFEVLLGTRGIMQLGWATVNCQFTNEVLLLDVRPC